MKTTYALSKEELEEIILLHVIKEAKLSGNVDLDDFNIAFLDGEGDGTRTCVDGVEVCVTK